MCQECYVDNNRITPLLNPVECLKAHTQYICGTCGRFICIEYELQKGLQRWNFPFKSADIAKLYLRTADYTMKKPCGIYEIKNSKGRLSYKIFVTPQELDKYIKKSKDKSCEGVTPVFTIGEYREYPNTEVRKVTSDEIKNYMSER